MERTAAVEKLERELGDVETKPVNVTSGEKSSQLVPAAITMSLITARVGMAGGMLLHRSQPKDISWETGILSMLPGGAWTGAGGIDDRAQSVFSVIDTVPHN